MVSVIVTILTFAAAFLAVFAGNAFLVDLYAKEKKRKRETLEANYRETQRRRARLDLSQQDLSKLAAEVRAELKQPQTWRDQLQFALDQSGLNWSPRKFWKLAFMGAGLTGGLFGALSMSVTLGLVGVLGGGMLPFLFVQVKRRARLNRMREQLPDAFDLMGRVMRAGQTISQAMAAVAEEFPSPISLEFLYCHEQMNLGLSADAALRELGKRTGLLEIRIFVLAVIVHRQTGGNLAELLDNLAHVVRERFRISGMIKSLTAQGRFQAMILMGLPVAMFFLLMAIQPEYEMLLFQYPVMIVMALGLIAGGGVWINRIVSFDY